MEFDGVKVDSEALLDKGLTVAWVGGAIESAGALFLFAHDFAGWNWFRSLLLPACLDVYWMSSLAVVLRHSGGTRVKASVHGFIAFAFSAGLQIVDNMAGAGDLHLSHGDRGMLIALVSVVPLLAVASITHLRILARRPAGGEPETGNGDVAGGPETETASGLAPAGNGNEARQAGIGNGAPAGPETMPVAPEVAAGPETVPAARPAAVNLALVRSEPAAAEAADSLAAARLIVQDDPALLTRRGAGQELAGRLLAEAGITVGEKRGRQLLGDIRAEQSGGPAAAKAGSA